MPYSAHKLCNTGLGAINSHNPDLILIHCDHLAIELLNVKFWRNLFPCLIVDHHRFRHREKLNVHIELSEVIRSLLRHFYITCIGVGCVLIREEEDTLAVVLFFDAFELLVTYPKCVEKRRNSLCWSMIFRKGLNLILERLYDMCIGEV